MLGYEHLPGNCPDGGARSTGDNRRPGLRGGLPIALKTCFDLFEFLTILEPAERAVLLEERIYADEIVASRCPMTDRLIGAMTFKQIADPYDIELGKADQSVIDGRYVWVDHIHIGSVEEDDQKSMAVEGMLDAAFKKCPGASRIAYTWCDHYRDVPGFPELVEDPGRILVLEWRK